MISRRRTALALPLLAAPALAQPAWPTRPIRIVVPWPPGQATDIVVRLMAEGLAPRLGVPVLAENRPGAGGAIGTDAVAKAAPDGHTLLGASAGPISINPLLQRMPYDAERDFAAVAMGGLAPFVLVARADFPAQTAPEFIARLRAEPGRFTFASSGSGSTSHLIIEFFNAVAGVQAVHVPFQGSAPGITAILGGQVDYTLETAATTMAHVRGGRLRGFGVSFAAGSALTPGLPGLGPAIGRPEFDIGAWIGLMAPAGTPAAAIQRLSDASVEYLSLPETRERFAAAGLDAVARPAADMAGFLREQRSAFEGVIRRANIRID